MTKPWLLLTEEEKEVRRGLYLECVSSPKPIDEFFLVKLKPPDSKIEALLELVMYSYRKRTSKC